MSAKVLAIIDVNGAILGIGSATNGMTESVSNLIIQGDYKA